MSGEPLSPDALRVLEVLRGLEGGPGERELVRRRNQRTNPPSNELSRQNANGEREVVADGVLDAQLDELTTARLLSVGATRVGLTERGRNASIESLEQEASIASRTLIYTRNNFWAALAGAIVGLAALVFTVLAVRSGGTGDDTAGDEPGPASEAASPSTDEVELAQAIRVDLQLDPDQLLRPDPVGGEYLTTAPIQDVPDPPDGLNSCVGRYQWSRALDPIDADLTNLEVQLTNTTDRSLRITNIKAVVDETRSPLVATLLSCPGRGALTERRTVSVDLDAAELTVRDGDEVVPPDFTLAPSEFEVFEVTAAALDCHCLWHLEFEILRDGEPETLIVDDDGRPFETSSSANARQYQFIDGTWFDVTAGGDGPPLPDMEIPDGAGDTCRHLPPELVEQVAGPGWELAAGTGQQITTSINPAGEPFLAEDCTYFGPGPSGVATAVQLLRFADPATAQAEGSTIAAQMAQGTGPATLDTDLAAEALDVGGETGAGVVVCGATVVIAQLPDRAALADLLAPVARSVDPSC